MTVKWLTTILALYLLGLSLWPCADGVLPISVPSGSAVLTATAMPDAPSSHQHQHDQCTPFCTCACCSATITVAPRFTYSLTPSVEITLVMASTFADAPLHWADPLTAIWQPPKLRV